MILCRPQSHRTRNSNAVCQARPPQPPTRLAGPVFLPPASPSAWARSLVEAARRASEVETPSVDLRPVAAAGG